MFTGIVQEVAFLKVRQPLQTGERYTIESSVEASHIELGESIALDGACMTVVSAEGRTFDVEISKESLERTTLGERAAGDGLNMERSMRANDRVGGHFVSGHVDGTGKIVAIEPQGDSWVYRFSAAPEIARLLVEKGSIAIDGISLTCFACDKDTFDVAVIRHTAENTTLGRKSVGASVNLENDTLGKYVAKLVDAAVTARLAGGT